MTLILGNIDLNPFDIIAAPIKFALSQLSQVFSKVGILNSIGSFGLAIIVITVLIRIILIPIFNWNLRIMERVAKEQALMLPETKELRKKYRDDPDKLTSEIQNLYKAHGISPLSGARGCLPAIVQFPILVALYNAIRLYTPMAGNKGLAFLWSSDLTKSARELLGMGALAVLLATILPLLAALTTWLQARMLQPPLNPLLTPRERQKAIINARVTIWVVPVLVFIVSLNFAQGIALYWTTQSVFLIVAQYRKVGFGTMNVPAWLSRGKGVKQEKATL